MTANLAIAWMLGRQRTSLPCRRFHASTAVVAAREQTGLPGRDERVVPEAGESIVGFAARLFVRHPQFGINMSEIERPGVATQCLATMIVDVFVKI